MGFLLVAHRDDGFDRWIAEQAEPAVRPTGTDARTGADLFLESGCGSSCAASAGAPPA
jgi:hypothetical protein